MSEKYRKELVVTLMLASLAFIVLDGLNQFTYIATIVNFPKQNDRFSFQQSPNWPLSNLDFKFSPVDLSFLNTKEKPAGKRGRVKVSGDALIFADGTPARFWGTNLTANTLFGTSRDNVRLHAKRLSELGFNLVRIHHIDSPWVKPNIFGMDAITTQTLDPSALDKLDWWIKCLKVEGIYVWLDLHVGRSLTEGDSIYGLDEIRKSEKSVELKGYNYINQSIQMAMKRFNEAYLNHVNAYTGVAYKNETAIMALLITNENDVTNHFAGLFLPDNKVPLHTQLYMTLANLFAKEYKLPADKTWRSWEFGSSKLFLNDLEHRFNIDMIAHLRSLGVTMPIATTSHWGNNPQYSLPSLTDGDIIDAHAYGVALELNKDPYTESSMVNRLSMSQISGKPMSVSEWNVSPFPAPDRHSSPLYMASAARLQGWDAVMQYAYSYEPLNNTGTPSNWQSFNDPALIATLPASALLFRQGHVKESNTTYALTPDREQLFYKPNSDGNSIAARTASERGKLVVKMPAIAELPWLESGDIPVGTTVIHKFNQSMIANDAKEVISDTGEIRRNWTTGIYTINTTRTQAALGWIGNESIETMDVKFNIKTSNASVIVQSMDGLPIRYSSSLMISKAAQAMPIKDKHQFRSEPVLGDLMIQATKGLRLYKNKVTSSENEISVKYSDGKYAVSLEFAQENAWLFLR